MKTSREVTPKMTTVVELGSAFRTGDLLPTVLIREYLRKIEALNPLLNCFLTVLGDSALKAAAESESRIKAGHPLGPLDGIPVAVKDLVYIEGVRCTAGSKILADFVAPYDAPVIRKLRAAGAVLIGTTNLHEFAAGVTNINPHYGAVRNPWDQKRISGGSSGGSAAAVAAGLATLGIGTDTIGSIRIPAALCGLFGLRPTYGRLSRLGVIPLSSSLDTVGILTASAQDAGVLLAALGGHEKEDITTVDVEVPDYAGAISRPFSGAHVGVVSNYFFDSIDPAVQENFEKFVSRLKEIGCSVDRTDLDWVSGAEERWLPIRSAEATAFHLRWLESSPELYGRDVRELLEKGKKVSGVEYISAVNARPSFMERFSETMGKFDFLLVPCTAVPAPRLDQETVSVNGVEVPVRSALIRFSGSFSYIGAPVASIPSGLVDGLPLGVQLVGKLFDESGILNLANAIEGKFGPYPAPPVQPRDPTTA